MEMIFLKNKYSTWYFNIIKKAQHRTISGYVEKHHVFPKSLGGTNDKDNIVKLTAREHFVCHLLLVKMTTGDDNIKMKYAVGKFIQSSQRIKRVFTSWEYKKIRESISEARKGQKHSDETRKKLSTSLKGNIPWNKGLTGIVHSDESNRKRSATLKGKTLEDKVGAERAHEIKRKISNSKIGKPSGMLGKTHPRKGTSGLWTMTDEGKLNVSKSRQGIQFSETHLDNLKAANIQNGLKRRGQKQKIITCSHCEKTGGVSGITRYHNDNCKFKKEIK